MTQGPRGFGRSEFERRTRAAQRLMEEAGLSALLLTTEPEVRYYTGFLTRFWESPTRPWFVLVPAQGDPVAVIPAIGAQLMSRTWIRDIRTWQAPDYEDDGIGPLSGALREVTPEGSRIGIAEAMESHARIPLAGLQDLRARLGTRSLTGDCEITRRLRMVKSEAEISKIRTAARIAGRAFDRVPEIARAGVPLSRVFRRFQVLCLEEGADWVPYLAGAADRAGYTDVISPAGDCSLNEGDVLMLDTGLVWDGYFCDFDRNYSVSEPSGLVSASHGRLLEAVEAGVEMARPGAAVSDLYRAMNAVLTTGNEPPDTGRLGHGLGMQLTEWPSVIAQDHTPLAEGMVLTLEPSVCTRHGKIMVHEENIVIRSFGAEFLSPRQDAGIRMI